MVLFKKVNAMDIKYYEFSNPIYPRKIWVVITNHPEKLNSLFEFKDYILNKCDFKTYAAFTDGATNKESLKLGILVAFSSRKYLNPKTIGHEAQHVLDCFITDCDLEQYPNDRNEHIAYLKGYIDECLWSVKDKNTKFKIFKTK